MPWKDSLALWILSNPDCDTNFISWNQVRSKFTRVMVKTVDVKRRVVNIQLEQHGQWSKPTEWAMNHIQSLRTRVYDDIGRLLTLQKPTAVRSELSTSFPTLNIHSDVVELKDAQINDLKSKLNGVVNQKNELVEDLGTSRALVKARDKEIERLKKGIRGVRTVIENTSGPLTPKPIKDLVVRIDSLLAKS